MALLAALLLALPACSRETATESAADTSVPVTVQPARLDTLRDVLAVSGLIVPAAATDWSVTATEAARIVELPKAEGDAVETGDLLVRLEVPSISDEIASADLALSEARSRAATARDEVQRLTPLWERGMIARNMFDNAKAALGAAEAAVAQAEARRDAGKQLLSRAEIRARFPGIVIKRFHNEGEFVAGTPTDPILRVIDPTKVQVMVHVPVLQVSRVPPGHAATVTGPGVPAEAATVVLRQPPVDATATTAEVRLGFAAPTTLTLDTPVQVEMVLEERRDVIVVSAAAVRRDEAGPFVMIARDDGVAERRPVRLGLVIGPSTQITQGVNVGERVITTGLDQVTDGTRITAK